MSYESGERQASSGMGGTKQHRKARMPTNMQNMRERVNDAHLVAEALNDCDGGCNPPPHVGEWCVACCFEHELRAVQQIAQELFRQIDGGAE